MEGNYRFPILYLMIPSWRVYKSILRSLDLVGDDRIPKAYLIVTI
jgi:hypothetical protein